MERHDPFFRLHGQGCPHRDRLLTDTTEPLGDPALTQQDEHLFLDHPWQQELPVDGDEFGICHSLSVEMHHDAKFVRMYSEINTARVPS